MDKKDRIERYAKGRPTFEWPSDVKSKKEYRDRIARPLAKLIAASDKSDGLVCVGDALMEIRDTSYGLRAFYLDHDERTRAIRRSVYVHANHLDNYKTINVSGTVRSGVIRELVECLPRLNGIVSYPIVTPSGKIVMESGYNDETGVYVTGCSSMFEHVDSNDHINVASAKQRIDLLCGHRVFCSEADKSRYVASILTSVMRSCFGAAPMIYSNHYPDETQSPILGELFGLLQGFLTYPDYGINANVVMGKFSAHRQHGDTVFWMKVSHDPKIEEQWREMLTYTNHKLHSDHWVKIGGVRNVCTVMSSSQSLVGKADLRGLVLPVLMGWSDEDDPYRSSAYWVNETCHKGTGTLCFEPVKYKSVVYTKDDFDFEFYRSEVFLAVLTLIRAWQRAGQPAPKKPSAFDPVLDEWYYYVAGVLEYAGYTSISADLAV